MIKVNCLNKYMSFEFEFCEKCHEFRYKGHVAWEDTLQECKLLPSGISYTKYTN